jgi:RNA polymerase sigma-70 factor (ECF subfamily)
MTEESKTAPGAVQHGIGPKSKPLRGLLEEEVGVSLAGLIAGVARKDQASFRQVYEMTAGMAHALALRILSNGEDAEEVVADVYMKVWRTAAAFDLCRGTPLGWILMMTRTAAIDRLRQRSSRPQGAADPGVLQRLEAPDPDPEQSAAGAERRRTIREVFARLAPEHQEVLSLAFFSGMSHSELAESLQQPLGTVKTRIRLGLQHMRRMLHQP